MLCLALNQQASAKTCGTIMLFGSSASANDWMDLEHRITHTPLYELGCPFWNKLDGAWRMWKMLLTHLGLNLWSLKGFSLLWVVSLVTLCSNKWMYDHHKGKGLIHDIQQRPWANTVVLKFPYCIHPYWELSIQNIEIWRTSGPAYIMNHLFHSLAKCF